MNMNRNPLTDSHEKEVQYQLLVQDLSDGVILIDEGGIIIECNPSFEKITGYKRDQTLGRNIWDLNYDLTPDSKKTPALYTKIKAAMIAALKNGRLTLADSQGEHLIQTAEGVIRTVRIISYLIKTAPGYSLVILLQNISEQKELEDSLRLRAEELGTLHEISLEIVSHHDLSTLVEKIVEKAIQLLRAEAGFLYLCDQDRKLIYPYVESHRLKDEYRGKALAFGEGAAGKVAQTGMPLIVNNYNSWSGRTRVLGDDQPYEAVLSVPLGLKDHTGGILQVLSDGKRRIFDRRDAELLSLFASQAAIAIENARLFNIERETRARAEALSDAARAIGSTLSLNQVLEAVLDHLARVLPFDSGNIMLIEGDRLDIKVWRGYDSFSPNPNLADIHINMKVNETFKCVVQTGIPLVIADVSNDPRWRPTAASRHIQSWMGVPLIIRDQVIGLLNLDRSLPIGFTENEIALAQMFASHAATAIANARLFENEGKRAIELEALRKASLSLTASLELEEVFEAILRSALALLPGANNSHIFLYSDDEGGSLKFGAALWADGSKGRPFAKPRSNGLTMNVARSGEPIVVPDMGAHPLYQGVPEDWRGAIVGIPLKIGQRVLGVMNVSYVAPHEFSESELRLLSLLGDQAAIGIENARLYEQIASEKRHLGLLFDISRELSATFEPEEILNKAVSLTTQALNGLVGQAFGYLPAEDRLNLQVLYGRTEINPEQYNQRVHLRLGEGLAGWVAQNRQALNIPDVLQESRWLHVPGIDEDVRSAISAPILAEQELIGVMTILHREPASFSDDHLELLQTICQQVGLAFSNATRYQEMKRRLAEITLISNLAQTFTRRLELQELLHEVVTQLAQLLGYPLVEIYLLKGGGLELRAFYGNVQPASELPITRGVIGRVARTGIAALVSDVLSDPDYCPDNMKTTCELTVPIFRGDCVIGVINIETSEEYRFDQQDLDFVSMLAGQISIALENAVLYEKMRQHADDLEQTVSRRTAELAELFELSQKISSVLSYEDLFQVLLSHLLNATGCQFACGCLQVETNRPLAVYTLDELEIGNHEKLSNYLKQTDLPFAREELTARLMMEVIPLEKKKVAHSVVDLDSFSHVPIQNGDRQVGALIVNGDLASGGEDRRRLLQTFANLAGSGIERVNAVRIAERKRLENLIEHIPNGVLLLDEDKSILVINPMGKEILSSLECDILEGRLTHLDHYTIDELAKLSDGFSSVEIVKAGLKNRYYEVLTQLVGEQPHQYIIVIREATQERETLARVQMQERLATVGQLAAGIAHDFNNIMAAILVYADLIRTDPGITSPSRDRVTIIQQQVQRAASLIRQILDFSRRSVMEQSSLDLLPFIKELDKMLRRVLPENIRLELAYQPGAYMVTADPTRLQQVFMNLALNSRDAMPEGGLLHFEIDHFCLKAEETPPLHYLPPGEWIRIIVSDTGTGIPDENIAHVFEPFFTTKPAGAGTGLGLAQVYGIIKQHEGYIDVKSKVGEGTTFTIFLPALASPPSADDDQESSTRLDGVGKTVMLVEDDRATREALRALLEAHNYNVLTAENGREALAKYEDDPAEIQMVISDVVMPEMGGVELYNHLKERDEDIKMLFVTGHPLNHESQMVLETGQVHWLQKPFSTNDFNQAVQRLFQKGINTWQTGSQSSPR